MRLSSVTLAVAFLCPSLVCAQGSDPARAAIAEGDLYQSKHKYELALDAYHKADKAAHHSSPEVYLKLAAVERKLGDFPSSLDNAKKALKAAGDDKAWASQAYLIHANLLIVMSSKPGDKKLKEAENDIRQAVALDPSRSVAHFDLGFVLLKQERDAEGIPELRTYVSAPGAKREETVIEAKRLIANPIRAREPFAPPFSFTSEEKQKISNASLRGKVVLLDFWGTWCPPCRESVPALRNVQKKFAGKEFQIVSVSSDDDEEVWRTFIASQQMSWAEYIDLSGEIQSTFKIDSFPTYIVLDRDGVIRYRQSGYSQSTGPELEEAINHALKRTSDPKLAAVAAEDERTAADAHSEAPARIAAEEKSSAASGGPSLSPDEPASPGMTGAETGSVERGIYRNAALAFSYEFPRNWVAAKQETLHALNESHEESAKAALLQQHPEGSRNFRVMVPKIIFYASRRGDGDGQRLSFPCIRVMATPSPNGSLDLATVRQLSEKMAGSSGLTVSAPSSEYQVKDHKFFRTDFERAMGGQRILQSIVQTHDGGYLVAIEIYALSEEDKKTAIDSLQNLVIEDRE